MIARASRILKQLVIFFFLIIPVTVVAPVEAITDTQRKALDGGALYTNTSEDCIDTSASSTGGIYLLGDSWMRGLEVSNPSITSALTSKGYVVTGVNYRSGRSITGAGTGHDGQAPQNALDAVDADAGLIASAGIVVIVLGTNSHGYDSKIPDLIDKLQGKKVYWVNTSANYADIVRSTSDNNAAIVRHSIDPENPYTVIDWFSKVYPGGDPTNIDVNATSPLMAGDRIHPSSAGYKELVNLIVENVSSNSNGSSTNTPTTGPSEFEANEKLAWDFFRTKMNLSENATAGILGNLLRENGGDMNPEKLSGVGIAPFMPVEADGVTPISSVYGKKGYGLAQWTVESRQLAFVSYSLGNGPAPFDKPRRNGDMQYQLDYIKYELESGYFNKALEVITKPDVTLKDAAEIINLEYEAPRSVNEPKRINFDTDEEYEEAYALYLVNKPKSLQASVDFANAMLKKYGTGESQNNCGNGPSTDSVVTGSGLDVKVGGVRYFSQCDPAWRTINYGDPGSTICTSGCGPTAASMIISTLKNDPSITPQVIADWGANNGMIYYENGESAGSKTAIAPRAAAAWGLTTRAMNKSRSSIEGVFNDGGYVFINVGPGDFTSGGHFIMLRGFDSNGKLLVSDPNDGNPGQSRYLKKSQTAWDFDRVMSQTRGIVGILP